MKEDGEGGEGGDDAEVVGGGEDDGDGKDPTVWDGAGAWSGSSFFFGKI